ncbi:ABC transporter ATP-binding protein [Phytomonospora endophytica]|uniref:Fatty acid ABC transporter ATP-binding/permease protein n=1 Tax=Phytomonospora endophytica TaxID=714109 RepID=A0A841FBC2_9ACTN|nr:ABC transporter ATP-binding protein [Phytomonospora endophytica]MBB6034571.1 ATP-binding cassette subfamily B protein [Phytomonospora endophytica]GIG71369.1 multidrug ABC transporter ATP-binding protein [Phytomonospora endophytica]
MTADITKPSGAKSARSPGQLRRIARLFIPYRGRLALMLLIIAVTSAFTAVSPFLLQQILDVAIPEANVRLLTWLTIATLIVTVAGAAGNVLQSWIANIVGQRVMHDLRVSVYDRLSRMSLGFFTRTRTGEVQSRINNDIGGVDSVVTNTVGNLVGDTTTLIAAVAAMLLLDWRLALMCLATIPLFVWIARSVGKQRRALAARRQEQLADVTSLVEESMSVSGILLGKTLGRGPAQVRRFTGESARLAELEVNTQLAGRWRFASIQVFFGVIPALVYFAAGLAAASGDALVSIGTLVAFTTVQVRMFRPLMSLMSAGVQLQSSMALFTRIFGYLDLHIDITEKAAPKTLGEVRGEVRFDHVGFAYREESPTLRDIDLTVAPGTSMAVVGATGSGKTTLGYLVARLYDVTEGTVTIDGVDVRDLSFESLTDTVGVVSQETHLFHATVAENLRFAKPDATDAELETAARAARIHEHIASLPEGYDTVVGERGYRFSGGEKQRLAIARMVLRNPPVLVLDEATSALDTRTEQEVQAALDALAEGRTTIAIAHRLSTIRDADQIVVLDGGRVAERGTHAELVALGGKYADLLAQDAIEDWAGDVEEPVAG